MVRSMIAGIAGLRTHQSKLDTLGNNIANVNTWGYKTASFNFKDSMYVTSIRGKSGNITAGSSGGMNPSQVGYGTVTSSISTTFEPGAPSPSSNSMDCMIDGTGFFLVGNMVNGTFTNVASSGLSLSRVGIFRVSDGYLVDDQGSYVYGYAVQDGTGIPETPNAKAVYSIEKEPVTITGPDATSGLYTVTIAGVAVTTKASDFEMQMKDWVKGAPSVAGSTLADFSISMDNFQEAGTAADGTAIPATIDLTVTKTTAGPDGSTAASLGFQNAGTFKEVVKGMDRVAGVNAKYSNELSTISIPLDPNTGQPYEIQNYKINADGTIIGTDMQERDIPIGQIALIAVENPNGLEKSNGYYYTIGANAGELVATTPDSGPAGKLLSGYLEMANVDLASEFSQMITTQRGFQANSKIITVTDQMLEELVNMKR